MSTQKIYVIIPFIPDIPGLIGSAPENNNNPKKLSKPLKEFYTNREEAFEDASNEAAKAPGTFYHVLESVQIFEAVVPTIHQKVWNDNGELQVKG